MKHTPHTICILYSGVHSWYEAICCKARAVPCRTIQASNIHALQNGKGGRGNQKRQRGVPCLPEIKAILQNHFLAACDDHGKIDRSNIIKKAKVFELLKFKIEEMKCRQRQCVQFSE